MHLIHVLSKHDDAINGVQLYSIRTGKKGRTITAEKLATHFNIPIEMVKKTLVATTQLETRISEEPSLTRKYCTHDRMIRYARMYYDSFMDTFFAKKGAKYLRGF